MDTEVFLRLPKGSNVVDINDLQSLYQQWSSAPPVEFLIPCLYGLKQAGQLWNQELDRFFTSIGFKRCDAETCLYARHDPATGKFALVLSEVDGLV